MNFIGIDIAKATFVAAYPSSKGYHRQIRKVTKNKGVFTNDTALEKLIYLAFTRIRRKWTQPVQKWGQTAQQLAIIFGDRFNLFE